MNDTKEMTALGPSVGADGGQSLTNTNPSIAEDDSEFKEKMRRLQLMQRINDPDYLPTISMNELYENVYQSRPPIIDGLLRAGTYLIAGAPKVGKSFLVAQIAYHVSTGQPIWGYAVNQGSVLYLALEDDHQRLQERMSRMFGVDGTDDLHFAIWAKSLGSGLQEQLDKFIQEHPNTKLVIIDTLQKVREITSEAYSYSGDYDVIGKLKQFADSKGICLLIVHHTRKQPASDRFETISGTTGLQGAADGAFVLYKESRTSNAAVLEVTGRDQQEQKLYLVRDEARLTWNLDHVENELWKKPSDPLLEKVAAIITKDSPAWTGSASELVALLGVDLQPNILTRRLNVKCGDLKNDFGITYTIKRNRHGSCISLSRLEQRG